MTLTDTITDLCRAVDAGDDEALGPLSDALEEAGRVREAEGLRKAMDEMALPWGPQLFQIPSGWWCWSGRGSTGHHWRGFHATRSAAHLAVAEELAD